MLGEMEQIGLCGIYPDDQPGVLVALPAFLWAGGYVSVLII